MRHTRLLMTLITLAGAGCSATRTNPTNSTFDDDLAFLRKHVDVILLADPASEARVAVVPQYQGRVMTSTSGGPDAPSYGWINRTLIRSKKRLPHMNPYGGEDRFWLGPEGGQYAVFFPPKVPFEFAHWETPALIDTEPFELASATTTRALFRRRASITNRAGFTFPMLIERTVRLLNPIRTEELLGITIPESCSSVAIETENMLRNVGDQPWEKDTGLLSIWILSMFRPSPATTVVIPIKPGPVDQLGPRVIDSYFGNVPPDRLIVRENVLYFRADGNQRGKLGIPPARALATVGSYDAEGGVLTLVNYTLREDATDYVNSLWEEQLRPYGGDVVNSYNDGPLEDGGQLGPFYEIETSSPAAALAPGGEIVHAHRIFHFRGPEHALDAISRKTLGVPLADIKAAFAPPAPAAPVAAADAAPPGSTDPETQTAP